jgi:hypothetical protein
MASRLWEASRKEIAVPFNSVSVHVERSLTWWFGCISVVAVPGAKPGRGWSLPPLHEAKFEAKFEAKYSESFSMS